MKEFFGKTIFYSFVILFFLTPIFFLPFTSELFEFNKIILTYILTIIIVFSWILKMIVEKKFVFRRTMLTIPILIFLLSQLISTFLSIDPHTSIFGYYSRFNGGFLSIISYSLLYLAFVSNIKTHEAKKILIALLFSAFFVSAGGILEHFGIDKNYWVQDVQRRVFSTVGQPNWLAAWLVAIIPITYTFYIKRRNLIFPFLTIVFFITLLFTKSRSGLAAFFIINIIYFLYLILAKKAKEKLPITTFRYTLYINIALVTIAFIIGTPWTPSIKELINKNNQPEVEDITSPALERGGTESGEIRKIVWKGAVDIWKHHPLFGSGVETFAYSYYKYRPAEHNLVSEWDYLYNKAHNEYLNYLATTGAVGFISYIVLIIASIFVFVKYILKKDKNNEYRLESLALFCGYLSILITNFFGFSVVIVQELFFLFPAIIISLHVIKKDEKKVKVESSQKLFLAIILLAGSFLIYKIISLWLSDYYYAEGKRLNSNSSLAPARISLNKAISKNMKEAVYYNEISKSAMGLALLSYSKGDNEGAKYFAETAINEANYAVQLSPRNMNIRRNQAAIYIELSDLDSSLMEKADEVLRQDIQLAPTDAKIFYNLALVEVRLEKIDEAKNTLIKTIELKTNYVDARYALALLYFNDAEYDKALDQLSYLIDHLGTQNEKIINLQKEVLEKIQS